MDMDELFLMLLKQPEKTRKLLQRFTEFLLKLEEVYLHAGIDFMMVVEGGGASISPKTFRKLVLPFMQGIIKSKSE